MCLHSLKMDRGLRQTDGGDTEKAGAEQGLSARTETLLYYLVSDKAIAVTKSLIRAGVTKVIGTDNGPDSSLSVRLG